MIANITSSSALRGFILYNENKIKTGDAYLLDVANTYNNQSKTAQSLLHSFASQSKRKQKFLHISLNFTSEDFKKLNKQKLKFIAQEYLTKIKLPENQPHIIYFHKDTNHPHIHIVTSSINSKGQHFDDSHIYRTSMTASREIETKYELTKVPSRKNEAKTYTKTKNFKNNITYALEIALKNHKATSLEELKQILNTMQLSFYTTKGTVNTKKGLKAYNGIVYIEEENQNQKSRGLKGSKLKGKPIIPNLEEAFKINKVWHLNNRKRIARELKEILKLYESISLEHLAQRLLKRNIEIHTKKDSQNNLVGIAFTDKKNNIKYSGEQIGKNFTARKIAHYLGEHNKLKPEILTKFELNKYFPKIKHLKPKEICYYLQHLGFNIVIENNYIKLNEHTNPTDQGHILLKMNNSLENIRLTPPKSNNVIQYNRAIILGNTSKANQILSKMENSKESITNNTQFLNNSTTQDLAQDHSILSDIDKKRKKRKGRKY